MNQETSHLPIESEELLRLIAESAEDFAIFAIDLENRVASWNKGVEKLLGYNEQEFIGRDACDIFTPEDNAQDACGHELRIAREKGRVEDKRWHLRKDGSRFWANGLMMALKDKAGQVRGFAKIMRDETARKRAEEEREHFTRALESERSRLEQILRQIPAGVSIVEAPTGKRLFANEEAERLLGHPVASGEDYQDYTHFNALHPDGSIYETDEYPTVRSLLKGETIKGEEMLYRHGDGRLVTLSVNSTPIREAEGRVVAAATIFTDITMRKRAEEMRFKLATIVESSDDAIISKDLTGRITSWNAGAERIFGYTKDEAVGQSVMIIIPPELRAEEEDILRRLGAGERIEHFETVRLSKSGRPINVSLTISPIKDNTGRVIGASKTARDITARKRAQEERERFFALGSDLLVVAGLDGHFKWVSPAWERTFGWTFAELTSHPWLYFTHPDDHERTLKQAEKLLEGQETAAFENRYRHKDGSWRWISWKTKPYPQEGLLYSAAIDITERKEAEEALKESERQLHTLADSIPQLAWMAEPDGHIFWYNRRWYDYTGTTLEEMQGWGWQSVHDPEVLPRVIEGWQASLATGEPFEMEFPLKGADGVFRWFLTRVNPLRDLHGRVIRWFGTNTDVDEQRRAAEQLREANRLKDEFLATLSHELRTPLTSILGWASMLSTGQLDAETAGRALKIIQCNARSQVQLIDDLLDVSRIITGKLRLDVRPVELAQVIESAVDSVRPAAEAKGIRLQILLDPQAGPVSGDSDRLQQVVWNLLTNAVKFTPKGGRAQVRLERVNSHVEITVSDTGRGITPEFLPHVFDRFRQADQTSTRAHGGLGLGLSIVRQLVELHGGSIHVESEGEGKGATFIVQLPLMIARRQQPERPERRHPRAGADAPLECPPQLAGLRVLIVEDEEDARQLLSAVLAACGSEVAIAASAAEALEQFEQSKPDVIVSDIGMPEEDGYKLIGKVRALEAERGEARIPAVALTAYARVEDRVRALNAGFQVHVPKPIEPIELVAVVASLAGRTGTI